MNILLSLLFWLSLTLIVYIDMRRYERKFAAGDDSALTKITSPGMWLGLVAILGIFAVPIYFFKTRGGIGILIGLGVVVGWFVVMFVILFLLALAGVIST